MYGKFIGYNANPKKSWLIVKQQHLQYAQETFSSTGIQITTEGRRQLGAVIGTDEYKKHYISSLVDSWIGELDILSKIAKIEPHAAYAAFTHGLQHRYTYAMRTIPNISDDLKRLDYAVDEFIIAILCGYKFNVLERTLFSLPVRFGGLGIIIPSQTCDIQYENSRQITHELTNEVKKQQHSSEIDHNETRKLKQQIKNIKVERNKEIFEEVRGKISIENSKILDAITEAGASNWLNALPIKEHGFYLDKQSFWDALYLRYNLKLPRLPEKCVCGNNFDVRHTLSFISIRHNEVRDLTAELLTEVCKDIKVGPKLTPVTGEKFQYKSANIDEGARVDVAARGFWVRGKKAFVDVRIFNPIAKQYSNQNLKAAHRRNEKEKKREYNDRIMQIEHGSFTPLVFSCYGGMSHECESFYKRLAGMISDKRDDRYSDVMNWIKTKLNFCLLRSLLLCVRGSRTHKHTFEHIEDVDIKTEILRSKIAT